MRFVRREWGKEVATREWSAPARHSPAGAAFLNGSCNCLRRSAEKLTEAKKASKTGGGGAGARPDHREALARRKRALEAEIAALKQATAAAASRAAGREGR